MDSKIDNKKENKKITKKRTRRNIGWRNKKTNKAVTGQTMAWKSIRAIMFLFQPLQASQLFQKLLAMSYKLIKVSTYQVLSQKPS